MNASDRFRNLTVGLVALIVLAGAGAGLDLAAAAGARPAQEIEPYEVRIDESGLSPSTIAVPVSSTVRWINDAGVAHNTTHLPDDGQTSQWNSYEIPPGGGEFEHVFATAGTYEYFDLFFPNDPDFLGTVIVYDEVPTPTPVTPTTGPTPTPHPTTTRAPTATPTLQASGLEGRLRIQLGDCGTNAVLTLCGGTTTVPIRSDVPIGAFDNRTVRVEGVMTDCPASGGRYLWMSSIQAIAECGGPPTPTSPPPTAVPSGNLALGARVTASGELPGGPPGHATDGSTATTWSTAEGAAWIYIDMGRDWTFNQVTLRWGGPHAVRYGLYLWDNDAWQGIYWRDDGAGGDETVSLTHKYGRYLLLYLVGSSEATGYALREWEVYGRDRSNLALGGSVVVSSFQTGHDGWHANDGDLRTGWASAAGQTPPWIRLHMPPGTELSELRLYWDAFAYPPVYSLVFYDQGYGRQAVVRAYGGGLHRLVARTPIELDALLVYAHQLTTSFVALTEVEVYGPGAFVLGGAGFSAAAPPLARRATTIELDGLWQPVAPAAKPAPALQGAPSVAGADPALAPIVPDALDLGGVTHDGPPPPDPGFPVPAAGP